MLTLPEIVLLGAIGAAVVVAVALLLSAVGDWSWRNPRNRAWVLTVVGAYELVVGALMSIGGGRFSPTAVIIALAGAGMVGIGAQQLRRLRRSESGDSS